MSYVIVSRATGKPIAEVFQHSNAMKASYKHFEVMPVTQWLARYNRLVRDNGGCEPTSAQFRGALKPQIVF